MFILWHVFPMCMQPRVKIHIYVLASYIDYIPPFSPFTKKKKKITFQIPNKLADLVPQLMRNTFEFWLVLPQSINVKKYGVNLAVPLYYIQSIALSYLLNCNALSLRLFSQFHHGSLHFKCTSDHHCTLCVGGIALSLFFHISLSLEVTTMHGTPKVRNSSFPINYIFMLSVTSMYIHSRCRELGCIS